MRYHQEKGLTLVELLLVIILLGIIIGAITPLLSTNLRVHANVSAKSGLHHEGLLAMERITSCLRRCTYLNVPNGQNVTRNHLIFSGLINDDNDYYFGDPLFPRIDEDPYLDRNKDLDDGLKGFDDDGDGNIDEGFFGTDDDEDGLVDEDDLDGVDNDGDGNVDEDSWGHKDSGMVAGVKGIDDDGDGTIDEGFLGDDDEDGVLDDDGTNEVLYFINGNELNEKYHLTGQSIVLSNHATAFTATYEPPDAIHAPRVLVTLTLTGENNETITFTEYVYPRNLVQKTGKRVR